MSLNYYLTQNRISSDANDFMAVSVNRESFSIDDVYDHMTRQGSTLTKAEALAAFEEIIRGIINIVQKGNSVVTPLVNIMPSISGVFDSEEDRFDASRHQVNLSISPGVRLRGTASEIPTEKVEARERQPSVRHYFDSISETKNEEVTANGGGRITGSRLKFDAEDANQGVFFINNDDNSEARVDTVMLRNMPSELIFINPDLPAGTYRLEVRSIMNGNSDVRSGVLSQELTVS